MNSSIKLSENSYSEIAQEIYDKGCEKWGPSGYSLVVFANGCFDILHKGHLSLLFRCKQLAGARGAVVVGVNSDSSVKRLKGEQRPILDEDTRCSILISLKCVDHVVSFEEDTPRELIQALMPDFIVKGGDHNKESVVGREFASVHIVNIEEDISTTKIIERINAKKI